MKDPHIPTEVVKDFLSPAVTKDFSSSTIKDFESPSGSRIYFPRQQSRISLSPAVKDLFSLARQLINLHAHTLQPYIMNIDKTHILHHTFHAT